MLHQAPYDAGRQHVARRPFTLGGRRLAAGDPIPSITQRLGRQLYDQRFIVRAKASQPASVAGVARALHDRADSGDPEAQIMLIKAAGESQPPLPRYTLLQRGQAWFDVIGPDGEAVNDKALRRPDADALLASLTS